MTTKELSQLYWLGKEIENDEAQLRELEAAAYAPSAAKMSGMPHSTGVGDPTGQMAAEIAELRTLIEAKRRRCMCERARLERYIAGVPDSEVRQILRLRFEQGLGWAQVAAALGPGNTAERARQTCRRYLCRTEAKLKKTEKSVTLVTPQVCYYIHRAVGDTAVLLSPLDERGRNSPRTPYLGRGQTRG